MSTPRLRYGEAPPRTINAEQDLQSRDEENASRRQEHWAPGEYLSYIKTAVERVAVYDGID